MILLGLSARPHLDSGQQALGTKLTLPADFTSREDFYKQLRRLETAMPTLRPFIINRMTARPLTL